MDYDYDVIIAGGGVAGCYLASMLDGLDILLIEKDKKVRPKDSGLVSTRFADFFQKPAKHLIKEKIREIENISPSGRRFVLRSEKPFLYMLKREAFSRHLRRAAAKKAEIAYETVSGVGKNMESITVRTFRNEYTCRLVVGADGANSVVRKSFGIRSPKLSAGLMVKADLPKMQDMEKRIKVFFNKLFSPDYFSWIIPQNNEYGLISAVRPKACLDYFVAKMQLPTGTLYSYMIPMGTTRSYADRMLLAGDACGQNKPLTGGGIIFSLTAAKLAAASIGHAFEINDFRSYVLAGYERAWKAEMQWEITKQTVVRRAYRKMTNQEIDALFRDFGPAIQGIENFDYDKFSLVWPALPKRKLIKFALAKARHIF